MRRQDKYPDTKTFHFYNANPKGKYTGDCRIRAISKACDIDYNTVVMGLALIQIETGLDQCAHQGISILMDRIGWKKMPQPRKKDGTKYTGREFCREVQKSLNNGYKVGKDGIVVAPKIFANIGGNHEVAIVDGKVWDTWDSTDGCIGNYWVKGA